MATLTVGSGQTYTTIQSAVAASASGDTVLVMAGTYTNDFLTISHSLTVQGRGAVNLVATASPPNGKAIIDEGGSGVNVTLNGLTLSGAKVPDMNGAGIRYEGGTLTLNDAVVTGNQDGLLANADPNGVIVINASTFSQNGAGDGYSHNIYVGAIASLTVQNSTVKDAIVGHDIKSRAATTTITGNLVTDTAGSASYEIDLPNGGVARIDNNTIEKGGHAENPIAISYGEEGNVYAGGSLSVTNNEIVNDFTKHSTTVLRNVTATAATVSGNTVWGWTELVSGPATVSGTTTPASEPALVGRTSAPTPGPTPAPTPPDDTKTATKLGDGPDSILLRVSEDAWQGDAQFTVSVDGQQLDGTQTATASHSAGQTQALTLRGSFGAAAHTVAVNFLNDAYGGTSATDRNLYVDELTDRASITPGATLYSNGSRSFVVGNAGAVAVGSGPNKAVLFLSEDAWQGDAQFAVTVDGNQVGGTQMASLSHAAGQSREFDILGAFGTGAHKVGVTFVNDAYGGTAATDRNLYVDKVGTTPVGTVLYSNGTQVFNATIVPA